MEKLIKREDGKPFLELKDGYDWYFIRHDDGDYYIQCNAIYKLALLEDLMEKYGIESVEELDSWIKVLQEQIYEFIKDRDTWKKACELACEVVEDNSGDCFCCSYWNNKECANKKLDCVDGRIDYFYTQALKEMKDEN